jgi:glutathione peroxidase
MLRATLLVAMISLAACTPREAAPGAPTATAKPASGSEGSSMSFHSFSAAPLGQAQAVPLSKYQGKVLLVANTAAHCGYTPQYGPLGEVDRKYHDKGFAVLGFVSDDFGHQAGTEEEVKACSLDHRATFDQFAQIKVKGGEGQHPLFAWLTSQPGLTGDVTWNFNKWLVGKHGELIARWSSKVEPDAPEVLAAIEAALAKP